MNIQHASHCVIFYNAKYETADRNFGMGFEEKSDAISDYMVKSIDYAQDSGYALEQYQAALRYIPEDVAIRGY